MKRHRFVERLTRAEFARATGALTRINSEFLEASGPTVSVGDYCNVEASGSAGATIAEVVAVESQFIRLVPISSSSRLELGATVMKAHQAEDIPVGQAFGGRAIDGLGRALDDGGRIWPDRSQPRSGRALRTLDRVTPRERLNTGIRAIDALLPLGKGQRVGIFAASGVGKTTLLEQLARQTDCDRIVMCLVGERGREVDKLWRMLRASENGARSTLVAATSDESPSLRLRAIEQAIGLAEHWRDDGDHVLLVVDSVTRVAQALRELGLAAGLPPTVRGLTPNVFSALPRFVERCGAAKAGGAITAIFSVLSETDDVDDPVVELMKSILDGHIILSRPLAEKRHFPAIDISRSVSRLAGDLLDANALDLLQHAHASIATFDDARQMIESGLYHGGASAEIDRAIVLQPALTNFLRQSADQRSEQREMTDQLAGIMAGGGNAS